MDNKTIIRTLFHTAFKAEFFDEERLGELLSPGYIQYANGFRLNFTQFIDHIKRVRALIRSCEITFETMVEENGIVFTNHIVRMELKNNCHSKSHVIAEFHVLNSKVVFCDELVRLLEGDKEETGPSRLFPPEK